MDRRSFLAATGALVVGSGGGIAVAPDEPALAGGHSGPVLDWEWVGGFVPAGYEALRAPRLVGYADGLVVADADRQLRLSRADLDALRWYAAGVLRDPANLRPRPGGPQVADVPATLFTVRAPRGRGYAAQVEALEATRFAHVYPRPLYGLLDRLAAVRRRVLAVGAGYRPDAVRLVAVVTGEPGSGPVAGSGPVPGWPAGVPVPPIAGDEIVGVADLRGAGARAVVRAVPPDWSTFRTADGRHLQAAWRRLLPHEGRPTLP